MTDIPDVSARQSPFADAALRRAAAAWFGTAVLGQWAFVYYILMFYGRSAVAGNPADWNRHHSALPNYVVGDTPGNLIFAAHVLLAATFSLAGALQVMPRVRAWSQRFHRWNGWLFLSAELAIGIDGLYLVWIRHSSPTWVGAVAISLNALVIFACVIPTWTNAWAGRIASHRRWALRSYIVGNGQWFFRVGAYAIALAAKPLVDPFFLFWGFGCYLVPLAILELYLRAQNAGSAPLRLTAATALALSTIVTALGIAGAYSLAWRPLISAGSS